MVDKNSKVNVISSIWFCRGKKKKKKQSRKNKLRSPVQYCVQIWSTLMVYNCWAMATIPFQIRAQELLVYANGSVDVFW